MGTSVVCDGNHRRAPGNHEENQKPLGECVVKIFESPTLKLARSKNYNFNFDKKTGLFMRWGATKEEDPQMCPVGPEILDIEISINGCPNACPFCYKNNRNIPPTNMSFETFKLILDKMPRTLTQIAFGITGVQTNPDFIKMMAYTRSCGIIPNFTLSGIDLTDELADEIVKHIGGLAVSAYESDPNVCYDTVKKFTDRGIVQTNIHLMVSKQTLPFVHRVLQDRLHDPRLKDLNAIIFLGVKPKGRAAGHYTPVNSQEFGGLLSFAESNNIAIGFDSCSAPKYEAAVLRSDKPDDVKRKLIEYSESCESTLFSLYINVHGEVWPCSFTEDEPGHEPVSMLGVQDFSKEIWYSEPIKKFRKSLIATTKNGCRHCPAFKEVGHGT
jgi:MoaA/NifB/PqqE/SkfB family radical SAM enzyme